MAALGRAAEDAARRRRPARGARQPAVSAWHLKGARPFTSDDERAGAGAARAAQAVRDRAVEAQRVALVRARGPCRRRRPRPSRGRRRSRPRRARPSARRASGGCARSTRAGSGRRARRGARGRWRRCARRSRPRRGGRRGRRRRGGAGTRGGRPRRPGRRRSARPSSTLGRASPRSTWERKGWDRPARRPRPLRVSPRSRRSVRTRAPRSVSKPLVEGKPLSTVFQTNARRAENCHITLRAGFDAVYAARASCVRDILRGPRQRAQRRAPRRCPSSGRVRRPAA